MGTSFFIVFGNDNFSLSGADVGLLTAILIGSQAVMQLALGWLGDRRGHKQNLMISAFAVAAAALLAISATDLLGLVPSFVLLGIGLAADHISRLNIVLEFAVPEDQPTFIGLTNTFLAPVVFLAPIFGGWVGDQLRFSELVWLDFCQRAGWRGVARVLGPGAASHQSEAHRQY